MSGLATAFSVLMVGHSLFSFDGPSMLQSALIAGMGDASVAAQITNGAPLKFNWEASDQAQGVDARAVLPQGGVTHLILTEAVPLDNHLTWSDSGFYAQAFAKLALDANPDTRIYVQETWHSLKSGTGEQIAFDKKADVPWRTRLDQDLAGWEQIADEIRTAHPDKADQIGLIPAGQALGRLDDEIRAGRIDGLGSIDALFADDIHLNDRGHYFVAMVQYATLTGQDPLGLPTAFSNRYGKAFDTPDPDLARVLQRVAWEAVKAYEAVAVATATNAPGHPPDPARASAAPRAPPLADVADLVQAPQGAVMGTTDRAIGLASVNDWGTQQPFLDVMKTARPWIGHLPGRWGGMDTAALRDGGYLDAEGWPLEMPRHLSSIGTVLLTDLPVQATSLEGRYRVQFSGTGVIEVRGRARNVRYGKGEVTFDYTPGPGSVDLRIQRINRTDPPRNITVVKLEHVARYEKGALFNPDWTTRIGTFRGVRFMDWMKTNDSTQSAWADRPLPGDVSYATGVPLEIMIALANELESDPWFNMPHLADDAYVRAFAEMVRDRLDPTLTAYVEFSNEVWNWQFAQARWADERARARWGQDGKWLEHYGLRAAEVARIWSEVFADEAEERLMNVISTQTGWLGLETGALEAPLGQAEGARAPATAFDAYAVSGYFGGMLGSDKARDMVQGWLANSLEQAKFQAAEQGLTGEAAAEFVVRHRFDKATELAMRQLQDGALNGEAEGTLSDLLGRIWPYHVQVARSHGLDLIMYEGGPHVVGVGEQVDNSELTAFMQHLNYTPEMGQLYQTLLKGWQAVGGQLFTAYADVQAPTRWGSWGGLRHLDDANPRWEALVNFQ